MRRILLLGFLFAACYGDIDTTPGVGDDAAPATATEAPGLVQFVDPADLPDMPNYPRAKSGKLQVVSAGATDLASSVEVTASICENPSMLMLSGGGGESWGYLLLLQVPLEGDKEVVYPVAHVDRGFPVPPASTIAVQRVTAQGAEAYQGLQGFAEITEFSENITGRFEMTVRHINSEEMVQLVGSFKDIEVHEIPPESCLPAAALGG